MLFIDAVNVKNREGQVASRPVYLALGVTVDGEHDVLACGPGSTATAKVVVTARSGSAVIEHPHLRHPRTGSERKSAWSLALGGPSARSLVLARYRAAELRNALRIRCQRTFVASRMSASQLDVVGKIIRHACRHDG